MRDAASGATGREKEIAVRLALGANWQRLLRQLLTESVMLGLIGGAARLFVANAMLSAVRVVNPGNIPRLEAIDVDFTVLAFTFVVSIVTGLLFGLAPAWRAARLDLNTALKSGGRGAQREGGFNRSRRHLRSLLVVSEVALALVLPVGAGLLIRSFVRVQAVSPGFNPENALSMRWSLFARTFATVWDSTSGVERGRRDMTRIVGFRVGMIVGMALIPAASSRWTGYAQQASGPGVVDPVSGATGKNSMLPSTGLSVARRRWEAGSRTAWHSHTHGQLIFVEEGRARMQKRGQKIVELTAGQSDYTPPNVVHWHGAAPGEHAIHVTVGFGEGASRQNTVTEDEYLGRTK